MDAITIIRELGVPVGILISIGFAIWHGCKWLSKNILIPLTEAHINLVNSMKYTNETNAATLKKISETLETRTVMIATLQEQNKLVIELIKNSFDKQHETHHEVHT